MSRDRKHWMQDETSDTGLHDSFHEKTEEKAEGAAEPESAPDAGQPAKAEAGQPSEAQAGPPVEEAARESSETPAETAAETPPASEPAKRSGGGAPGFLWALALLLGGGALAVWGLPKVAPSLPAPIAAYLTPAGDAAAEQAAEQIAALRSEFNSRFAQIESMADAAAVAASRASEAAEQGAAERAALRADLTELASSAQEAAPAAGASEEEVSELRQRIDALAAQIDGLEGGQAAAPADLSGIESEVAGLAARLDEVEAEAEAARGAASDVAERFASMGDAEAAREAAMRDAENARRGAEMAAALARIDRAMTLGQPFVESLNALTAAAEEPAPPLLTQAAATGAPTRETLKASYPAAAYDAISAMLDKEAEEKGGMFSGVAAKLQARVTGLPAEAIPGDSVTAVLSRARITLLNGDIDATIAAIESLPEPAQEAMAEWVEGAKLRSGADAALSSWRNDLKLTL